MEQFEQKRFCSSLMSGMGKLNARSAMPRISSFGISSMNALSTSAATRGNRCGVALSAFGTCSLGMYSGCTGFRPVPNRGTTPRGNSQRDSHQERSGISSVSSPDDTCPFELVREINRSLLTPAARRNVFTMILLIRRAARIEGRSRTRKARNPKSSSQAPLPGVQLPSRRQIRDEPGAKRFHDHILYGPPDQILITACEARTSPATLPHWRTAVRNGIRSGRIARDFFVRTTT